MSLKQREWLGRNGFIYRADAMGIEVNDPVEGWRPSLNGEQEAAHEILRLAEENARLQGEVDGLAGAVARGDAQIGRMRETIRSLEAEFDRLSRELVEARRLIATVAKREPIGNAYVNPPAVAPADFVRACNEARAAVEARSGVTPQLIGEDHED